jgi:competence protein ComGC
MPCAKAFTLVEMLVLITIIVVLLALLAPALDQAIYQAELAICATNHHGVGVGVLTYAIDNARLYPHLHYQINGAAQTSPLVPLDDRPYLKGYLDLKLLLDPFLPEINLANKDKGVWIFSTINLYYGFQYARYNFGIQQSDEEGMFRLGDKLEQMWKGETRRWGFLASDRDEIQENRGVNWGTHPDKRDVRFLQVLDDDIELGQRITYARWQSTGGNGTAERGPVDLTYLRDDGSVVRYNDVKTNTSLNPEERMGKAPIRRNTNYYWPTEPVAYIQIPRH